MRPTEGASVSRVKYVAAGTGGGALGFAIGKLTGGNLKDLLSLVVKGTFTFLHEQGAYASFAIVMAYWNRRFGDVGHKEADSRKRRGNCANGRGSGQVPEVVY